METSKGISNFIIFSSKQLNVIRTTDFIKLIKNWLSNQVRITELEPDL